MAITAQEVKKLRDLTQAGMMECKAALTEAEGDFDAAIDILRKKGQAKSAKRADREAKEGVIGTALSADGKTAVIVEINCETDFVARNSDFQSFADTVTNLVLAHQPADMDALHAIEMDGGTKIGVKLIDMAGSIGEKIDVRRFTVLSSDEGQVVSYIHPGARLGVLVDMNGAGNLSEVGRDVAMQVAALDPVAVRPEEVSQEVKEKELDVARELARNEGKPEAMLDNIAQGRLKRYYKDNVLVEQPFVKDEQMSVGDMLKKSSADVKRFVRFALGG
jgi:elongation factor Ts